MMTTTKLTPEFLKDMFGQFLSVAIKKNGLAHNVFLSGPAGCGKLSALIEILKERDKEHVIFDSKRIGLHTCFDEILTSDKVIIIDELTARELCNDSKLSDKLKELMDYKKIIISCHENMDERNDDYSYKSVVSRCLVFHYPLF